MHLDGCGEADRLTGQTLNACAQRQMFPLDLLRVPLPRGVLFRGQVPLVSAPMIRVIARDAKRFQKGFSLQKDVILTPTKDIGQDLPAAMIDGTLT